MPKDWDCSTHLFPRTRDLKHLQVSWESQPHLLWLRRCPLTSSFSRVLLSLPSPVLSHSFRSANHVDCVSHLTLLPLPLSLPLSPSPAPLTCPFTCPPHLPPSPAPSPGPSHLQLSRVFCLFLRCGSALWLWRQSWP